MLITGIRYSLLIGLINLLMMGCSVDSASRLESSFAIQAGQDRELRDGTAPTLVALSDWFQKFTIKSEGSEAERKSLSTSALINQIDTPYHKAIIEYLDKQIERNEEFSDALADNDREALTQLLKDEVDEMYDIAGSLLDRDHVQRTDDLFAKFIKLSWRDDFVDDFASDFIATVLSNRLLYEVNENLDQERRNYQTLLINKYLDDEADLADLGKDLGDHLEALYAMKGALAGDANLIGGNTILQGIPAVFGSYSNEYFQNAQQFGYGQPATPSFLAGVQGDNAVSGNQVENIKASSPYGFGGGGFDPFDNGGGFDPYSGGGGFDPYSGGGNVIIMNGFNNPGFTSHLSPNWFRSDYQAPNQFRSPAPTYSKPNIDCRNRGLEPRALVTCQRYLAYTGLEKGPRYDLTAGIDGFNLQDAVSTNPPGASIGPGVGAPPPQQPAGPVANTRIIREGATRVVDQGAEPSCTAAAMAGSLESMAKMQGKAISLDHRRLWAAQGQQPMMHAAQQAARTAWADQGVRLTSTEPVRDLAHIVDGINAGKVTHLGIDITDAWTAGGGGLEFGLQGNGNVYTCQSGSGMGHAVSVQGYIEQNGRTLLIIKNSWGRSWGDNGFALVDPASCLRSADGAVLNADFGGGAGPGPGGPGPGGPGPFGLTE